MAIAMTSADSHMYCVGSNFKRSIDPYTINVWINANWNGATVYSFVGMYDGATVTSTPTTGLQIGSRNGAGDVVAWTYGGTVLVGSANGVMTAFSNKWAMVTYTFDGTNHRLYVNGVQTATATGNTVTGTFTQVYINGYPPTGNTAETSAYSIDAYEYYGRTLPADEVLTLYNAAGTRHGIEYSAIVSYEFDEKSEGSAATSVVDLTGHGNTLIPTGAVNTITHTYIGTVANSNTRPVL
jgi:hypothetical protein